MSRKLLDFVDDPNTTTDNFLYEQTAKSDILSNKLGFILSAFSLLCGTAVCGFSLVKDNVQGIYAGAAIAALGSATGSATTKTQPTALASALETQIRSRVETVGITTPSGATVEVSAGDGDPSASGERIANRALSPDSDEVPY